MLKCSICNRIVLPTETLIDGDFCIECWGDVNE
jgi:hypothetical protein